MKQTNNSNFKLSNSYSKNISTLINFNKYGVECGICGELSYERGKIDSCDHLFCLECINKWVTKTSTCPLCRRNVNEITTYVSKRRLKEILKTLGRSKLKEYCKEKIHTEYLYIK